MILGGKTTYLLLVRELHVMRLPGKRWHHSHSVGHEMRPRYDEIAAKQLSATTHSLLGME